MNLENFRKDYLKVITESTDEDLKNYIRSVVKETLTIQDKDESDQLPSYGPGPLTMAAIGMVSGYDQGDYNMPMVPKKYDLEKIEAILVRAEKDMTPEEYDNFIQGTYDDQKTLINFTKYKYLLPAYKFLNWVMDN